MVCNKNVVSLGIAGLLVLCGAHGLLKGPNYSIKDTVRSDGLVNTYELETKYGPSSVESTVFLLKRINGLKALDSTETLQGTDTFAKAAQAAATLEARGWKVVDRFPEKMFTELTGAGSGKYSTGDTGKCFE